MSQKTDEDAPSLRGAVADALEAARLEVVGRMTQKHIPLSVAVPEMHIVDNDTGGSGSEWAEVQRSSLRDFTVQQLIGDNSVPLRLVGLRPQLEPLAALLDNTTDLGTRSGNLLPAATGVDAILVRYVTPLAYEYLLNLPDLSQDDPELIARVTSELEELIDPDIVLYTSQLAIEGVRVSLRLDHRGVTLRQLSPGERGRYWLSRHESLLSPYGGSSGFFVPHRFTMVTPSTLLEVTTSRPRTELMSQSTLLSRVALAFYLLGYNIAGTGIVVSFDRPAWATLGQSHQRYIVDEKPVAENRLASEEDFRKIVDLAYQMPEFGPSESSSQEIALYRVLRGLGMHWQESGFLDFVIALEAALLPDVETELSYRFALYGSLFLASSHDPQQTFEKLRNIYTVRSKLVHGSKVTSGKSKRAVEDARKRQQALDDGPELAKAIVLRAIQHGWPQQKNLNELALKVT